MVTSSDNSCQYCGKKLMGRSDKKFCDDYCRNVFNNRLKANEDGNASVKRIDRILKHNRKVLRQIYQKSNTAVRISRDKLLVAGLEFNYFTHQYTTRNKKTYHYCYEYGYLLLGDDVFLIVKRKEEEDD